ncbi:hypothetical protein NUH88_02025 [Nisaea acidiphila]|uniref:Tetratricopeptide repeat protein n=1 Tax=Nisaea acidiphila TaxID=1862145 RepID=A0A9J7AW25_9PROT|nr:hypothetical protein [Nisaea acidiphila]UUX50476.1 hypothetical protein NUH88_02025 [Nisaea acidiphila]
MPGRSGAQRRLTERVFGLVFVVAWLVLAFGGAVQAQQVSIAGASRDGVDSIRFDWPARVGYSAQKFGSTLAVTFNRNVAGDFGPVAGGVGKFVSAVSLDSDNRTVLIDLSENPRFRSRRDGNSVVIDFYDRAAAAPPAVAAPRAAPAPAPPPTPAAAQAGAARAPASPPATREAPPSTPRGANQPILNVRTGAHDRYFRFVFDWTADTPYTVSEQPDRTVLRFARSAWIDDAELRARVPDRFKSFSSVPGVNAIEVTIPLQARDGIRHFKTGTRIVLDVVAGGEPSRTGVSAQPAVPVPAAAPSQPVTAAIPPSQATDTAQQVAKQFGLATLPSPRAAEPSADGQSVAAAPAPVTETAPGNAEEAVPPVETGGQSAGMTDAETLPTSAAPLASRIEDEPDAFGTATRLREIDLKALMKDGDSLVRSLSAGDAAAIEGPVIPMTASIENNVVSVRFEWTQPVPAAVFSRAGYVWVVFGAPARFDMTALERADFQLLGAKSQVPVRGGSAVRFPTVEGVNPRVWRDNAVWIVDFRPQNSRPDVPLRVDTQLVSAQGPRVFIPMEDHGATVILRDPEIGDQLFVVPVASLSRGIDGLRQFVEFNLLNTAQGVVVQPFSDDVTLRSLPDGVAVTKTGGLTISREVQQSTDDQVAQRIDGLPPGLAPGRIFDFSNWRKGDIDRFLAEKQAIQRRISEATSIARSGPRLELAHFYFAHGLSAEAMGLIRTIEVEDEDLARRPDVKALKGAAQFMLGRFKEAEEDLMDRSLNGLSEAELWRGATKASQGRWPEAVEHFARAGEIPGGYPRNMATQMALLAAEAAIRAGDFRGAGAFIDVVADGQPTPGEQARLNYLRGRVLYASGDVDTALDFWRRLAQGEDRWARVRSERALIEHGLRNGQLSQTDAIAGLESLRYTWRGDQVEFDLLRELGRLYLEEGEYVKGLNALREAVTFFPDNLYADQVAEEMTNAFTKIFTGGESDQMTPIQALSLYDQFRELTPVGARGDEIIQRLADRLVQVDLLDRASILLERQVKFRLQGEDKARVGARLALIRLLDRRPEEALDALDESVAPGIGADLALERKRLRARAEFELGDADGALRLLSGDQSRDADLLRADIFWRTQRWGQAAEVFQRLVGRSGRDGRRIDERAATLILNWAVSLSLSNNLDQLSRVRQLYTQQMDNTPFREAFRLITNKTEGELDDFRTLADRFGEIGRFQAFLTSYRDRLRDKPLSATN